MSLRISLMLAKESGIWTYFHGLPKLFSPRWVYCKEQSYIVQVFPHVQQVLYCVCEALLRISNWNSPGEGVCKVLHFPLSFCSDVSYHSKWSFSWLHGCSGFLMSFPNSFLQVTLFRRKLCRRWCCDLIMDPQPALSNWSFEYLF